MTRSPAGSTATSADTSRTGKGAMTCFRKRSSGCTAPGGPSSRGAPVVPWAFAIARRLVIDQAGRDRRSPSVVDDLDPDPMGSVADTARPEQAVEARQTAQRLAGALAQLPDSQRTAFELLKQDGLTLAEAAAVLGVTATAVKLRAHRAYESLRAALGEDAPV